MAGSLSFTQDGNFSIAVRLSVPHPKQCHQVHQVPAVSKQSRTLLCLLCRLTLGDIFLYVFLHHCCFSEWLNDEMGSGCFIACSAFLKGHWVGTHHLPPAT